MKLLFFLILMFSSFQLYADTDLSDRDLLDIVNKKGFIDNSEIDSIEPITSAGEIFKKNTKLIYIDYPTRSKSIKFFVAEAHNYEYIPDRNLLIAYGWDFGNGNPSYPRELSPYDPNIFLIDDLKENEIGFYVQNKYYKGYYLPGKNIVLGGVLKYGSVKYGSRGEREWAQRFHGNNFQEGAPRLDRQLFKISIYNQHFAIALPIERQFEISLQNSQAKMVNYRVVGMNQTHYIVQSPKSKTSFKKINKQDLRIKFLEKSDSLGDRDALSQLFSPALLNQSDIDECSKFLL